ncbi:PREDICTED: retinitis pigmentosa 1-like 1 protein, partial [Buceros rhinoceros silvestris]|uniref:retinitis pigmentosa 1-like 1 protein n=1 Tax=Buceros rhinoceros silvestris TaxID=175836 RepID=UPI000528AF94
MSLLGSRPGGTAASLSTAASQEEMGAWEEEMPTAQSPREPEMVAQEVSGPGQTETGQEEPERREDEGEAPSMETSHPSEDEEERTACSPCVEDDGDFQGEGMDARGEVPQRDAEAAPAVLVESHVVLPTESHLEEDLVDGEQEKFEHQEMPVCETELAAEEGGEQEMCPGQETCPGQEISSIHEAIPAEEALSGAEEDAVEREDPDRANDGEGEKGEAGREVLGEDAWAGEAAGPETPGQEMGAGKERGDLQENGFVEEVWEQEELEPGKEPWGREEDGNSPKPCPEDGEVAAEATEGAPGNDKQGWADDNATSEPARDEQEGPMGQPPQAPTDTPGQGDSQEPTETPQEPWEAQDEGADDELDSERGQPESSSTGPEELQREPGDIRESGEVPAVVSPSQNPPEMEETTGAAPASAIAPEDEGWLEGEDKPPTPTVPESRKEEAETEAAPAAEGAEEEEGYFMVSAPSQEMSSSEEAEISEDFEEIKVEATEAGKDDLEAPVEESLVPEDEGHFEAFVGEADEDVKMPPDEPEMPKEKDEDEGEDEDNTGGFTTELEEGPAEPEASPSSAGAVGPLAGGANDPDPGTREGPGHSEDQATEPVEALDGTAELESCNVGLVGQEEEEEEEESNMAHHDTAEILPPAGLQAQAMPVSPLPDQAEQMLDEQPAAEEEAPNGDSPLPAGDEEPPEADSPRPGSALEQGGFPEAVEERPEAADPSAKMPADVLKDSDILEIVEQALEFNQELVMGVRVAEEGQRDAGGTELPRD